MNHAPREIGWNWKAERIDDRARDHDARQRDERYADKLQQVQDRVDACAPRQFTEYSFDHSHHPRPMQKQMNDDRTRKNQAKPLVDRRAGEVWLIRHNHTCQ